MKMANEMRPEEVRDGKGVLAEPSQKFESCVWISNGGVGGMFCSFFRFQIKTTN